MTNTSIMNPQQKMMSIYMQNMQKTIQYLCKIVNTLVQEDQVSFQSYQRVKQILGDIRYYQKFTNKQKTVSQNILQTISVIEAHSEHYPGSQIIKQDFFPPVRTNRQLNLKNLATIAQKQSQQNLLHNLIKKQNRRKTISKYLKTNQGTNKTINDPVSYLNTSREYQVIREQTRRSLDNGGIQNRNKKALYNQLQKIKGTQQIMPAVKNYLQKHNHKRYVVSRSPNYTISKFI